MGKRLDFSYVHLVCLVSKHMLSKDFEVPEGWKSCGTPVGFICNTPGTRRSVWCRVVNRKSNAEKKVFGCKEVLLSEFIISSNLLFFSFPFFVFKNGRNIHIMNKIKIKIRIRRTMKRYFLFLVEHYRKLNLLPLKIYSTSFQQSVGKIHNISKSSSPVFFNP